MRACEDCGAPLEQAPRGRPRKYCLLHRKRPRPFNRTVSDARSLRRELVRRAVPILSGAGWTMDDIANLAGYAGSGSLANLGAKTPKRDASLRAARMVEMYRSGMTLGEIGQEYNITRERVRQLISKLGISKAEGGIAAKRQSRQVAYQDGVRDQRNQKALKAFGCDYDTAVTLNGGAEFNKFGARARQFTQQKRSARNRHVGWELTFPEWCRVWDESGKWPLRGRGREHYCMSRKADAGPYAINNVRIITNNQNIAEGWDVTPACVRMKSSEALRTLQRRVYELRVEGKSHAEIADELGISAKSSSQYCVIGKRLHGVTQPLPDRYAQGAA